MAWSPSTALPKIPPSVMKKGVIPLAFITALTGPASYRMLERLEGNILHVYADRLASNIPTYCAGRTDWKAPIGVKLTSDQCKEVNKVTLLEYGYAILACTTWEHLTPARLVSLTIFSINVGTAGACGSQAIAQINKGNIEIGCKLISTRPDGRPNWSYAEGVFVQGLQNRRLAEAALCLKTELENV